MSARDRTLGALGALLLALSIGWAYWPILGNAFVWDDLSNLVAARPRWDGGAAGIAWAFREPFAGHYQPLTWLSYRLDALLTGATPRGVHSTQIALHLLVTFAVAALAHALARGPRLRALSALQGFGFPLLAAALFGLAPIRVESVAWATERRDLLGALFAALAVLVHLRTAPPDAALSRGRYAVAALAALSALSRAQMSLPFVLLALDLWPLGRLGGGAVAGSPAAGPERRRSFFLLVREKTLLLAIAGASAAAAIWAQSSSGALTAVAEHGLLERAVQAGYGLFFYPAATFLPQLLGPLLPLYERPFPFPALAARYLLPALASLVAAAAIWRLRRRAPALWVSFAAYALLVLPVLGIAQSGIQLVADRYAYLATMPLVLLAAGGVTLGFAAAASRRGLRTALAGLLLAYLAFSLVAARRQTAVWQSDETLWRHVLAHSRSSLAHNNLGQLLAARGQSGQAIFHLASSLEQTPQYGRPWASLAALLEAPWPADAPPASWVAATLARALPHQPGLAAARFATALAFLRSGDEARARLELERLLAADPGHDGARIALARLAARGN